MSSPIRLQAMEKAVEGGDAKKVRLLLKAGVGAGDGPRPGTSFLHLAAVSGEPEVFQVLLEAGADPSEPGLLDWAAGSRLGCDEVVRQVLEATAPDQAMLDQAAGYAASVGRTSTVELLVARGAARPAGAAAASEGDPEDPVAALRPRVPARAAWVPEVSAGEDDPGASKFAGVPRLGAGDPWPTCGHCGDPMALLLQLDLAATPHLPEVLGSDGFLQVFYCLRPDTYCEQAGEDAFSPFGAFRLVRIHRVDAGAAQASEAGPAGIPAVPITGWRELPDRPDPSALAADPELSSGLDEADLEALEEHQDACEHDPDLPPWTWRGDKLGGWPLWLQEPEEVACPTCGEATEFLLQLASRDHLAHDFGDCGVARLVACRTHPEHLGFSWAGS